MDRLAKEKSAEGEYKPAPAPTNEMAPNLNNSNTVELNLESQEEALARLEAITNMLKGLNLDQPSK